MTSTTIRTTLLRLVQGDITEQEVDAIVNAANATLMGGGGVDGAIHRQGGAAILEDCKRVRAERYPEGMPTGDAVLTTAGRLRARAVIHTVGPVWRGGQMREAQLLARAYHNCLALCEAEGLRTLAFPSISTGAYGYPKSEAARVALDVVVSFLRGNTSFSEVRFVLYSEEDLHAYAHALEAILGA